MGVPVEVLRRVPLLSTVDDEELAQLAGRFCERTYDRGAPVVSRGSSGAGFFIIAEGEALVGEGAGATWPGGVGTEAAGCWRVRVARAAARSGGVPSKTIGPPSWPAPGPRSMIQSAGAMTAWGCSMTMTDLPESTSRSSRPR